MTNIIGQSLVIIPEPEVEEFILTDQEMIYSGALLGCILIILMMGTAIDNISTFRSRNGRG